MKYVKHEAGAICDRGDEPRVDNAFKLMYNAPNGTCYLLC